MYLNIHLKRDEGFVVLVLTQDFQSDRFGHNLHVYQIILQK